MTRAETDCVLSETGSFDLVRSRRKMDEHGKSKKSSMKECVKATTKSESAASAARLIMERIGKSANWTSTNQQERLNRNTCVVSIKYYKMCLATLSRYIQSQKNTYMFIVQGTHTYV